MSQCIFKREIHAGDWQLAKPLVSEVPYKIRGFGFRGSGFRGSRFWVLGSGFRGSGFKDSGFRVQPSRRSKKNYPPQEGGRSNRKRSLISFIFSSNLWTYELWAPNLRILNLLTLHCDILPLAGSHKAKDRILVIMFRCNKNRVWQFMPECINLAFNNKFNLQPIVINLTSTSRGSGFPATKRSCSNPVTV